MHHQVPQMSILYYCPPPLSLSNPQERQPLAAHDDSLATGVTLRMQVLKHSEIDRRPKLARLDKLSAIWTIWQFDDSQIFHRWSGNAKAGVHAAR